MASYNDSYQDDFDGIEDDVDYSGIGEEEWVALNTQITQPCPPHSRSGLGGAPEGISTSHAEGRLFQTAVSDASSVIESPRLERQEFVQGSSTSPGTAIIEPALTTRRPSTSSSAYFSDDDADFDTSFLEQLDRAEREVIAIPVSTVTASTFRPHTAPADSTRDNRSGSIDTSTRSDTERSHLSRFHDVNSSNRLKFDSPPVDAPTTNSEPSSKRRRSCSPSVFPNKKAKAKQDELLDDFSDEISCPICFDLLVGAHLLNPCGHTLCGPCSYTWITLKKQTTCPVCRTKCCHFKSLIPNIIVDNIVEKYIEIQVARGDEVWDVGGSKRIDWEQRLDKWRRNVNCTRAPPKKVQPTQNIVDPDILFGMHAMQSSNTHVPRSIFELLAGQ